MSHSQLPLPLEPLDLPQQTHVRRQESAQFDPKDFYNAVKNNDPIAFAQLFPIVRSRKYALNYFTTALNIACDHNYTEMVERLAPLANCNAIQGKPLISAVRHNNMDCIEALLPHTHFPSVQSKALAICVAPQFHGPALDYLLPHCKAEHDDGGALYAALSHGNMELAQKLYPVSNVAKVWSKIYSPNFGPAPEYLNVYIEDLQLLERHHLEQQLSAQGARNARKI